MSLAGVRYWKASGDGGLCPGVSVARVGTRGPFATRSPLGARFFSARRTSPSMHGFPLSIVSLGLVLGLPLGVASCRSAERAGAAPSTSDASRLRVVTVPMPPASEGSCLFAAHCAACHGREGRGNGRAIIALGIMPRDFWEERFRYVSATNGVPTQDDLVQTIRRGRRFGEMPANPQLTDAEVLALADYVRELNRRGWLQRLTEEFGDDEDMEPEDFEEIAEARVTPGKVLTIPWPARDFRADLAVGRELYEAGCASCHGPTGRGDGLDKPLDELGKPIAVRDLTSGRFRGGIAPDEVFKRIRCGVPGTPMPAQWVFTDEEVWHLIGYVEFLAGRQW